MHTRYRAPRLLLLMGLLSLGRLGLAQTAATRQDSLKGQIWTATARHIWADTKPPQPQPAPWPTVGAFETWRTATPTDKSELGLLWGDVVKSIGAGAKGTPEQVARAILTQIAQRQQSKTGRLTRLKLAALQTDLTNITQSKSGAAAPLLKPDSVVSAPSPDGVITQKVTENTTPVPEPQAVPAPASASVLAVEPPHYFGLPAYLAGAVLALLGAALGAGITYNQLKNRHRHRRHHSAPAPAEPLEPETTSVMNSPEYRKLQKQNQNLNAQLQQIKQQLDELRKLLPGAQATTVAPNATPPPAKTQPTKPAVPASTAPPITEELSVEEMVGAVPAPPPPLPPATRYGPVQETPFVEERKIVDSPLPQLALMLTVNPKNPDQATFTLNPQVDQARLIGDGLTRLQKFFDYDLPAAGRITSVAAGAKGTLQRHADGWQVVERARLLVS